MPEANRQVISVSDLNRAARQLLESEFPMLWVEGEISNLSRPASGHWYFTLKDDKAQIRCAMFRNRNQRVRFRPKDGQQIIVRGRISLYEGRGDFQLIAEHLEESGEGELRRAFEKLRATLQAEGLFDESRKQPLPAMPNHVVVITSPSGAAIRDVLHVTRRRFPALKISILPVQVQGEDSPAQIVRALALANRDHHDPVDLILLTRGGGSLEDLWSFNTEPVARAVAASQLPVVSAVGHESDVSITDFIADLRAPTPSAAAEIITPDVEVWLDILDDHARRLDLAITQQIDYHRREVNHLTARLRHPSHRLTESNQRLDDLAHRLQLAVERQLTHARGKLQQQRLTSPLAMLDSARARLAQAMGNLDHAQSSHHARLENRLVTATARLDTLSPLATLQRGYAIVTKDDHVVTDAKTLMPGDTVRTRLQSGEFNAEVIGDSTS